MADQFSDTAAHTPVLEEAQIAANTIATAAAAAQRVNPGGANTPPQANLPRLTLTSTVPCAQCKKRGAGLICAGCEQRWYCARPCQRRHWKALHKNECDRSKDKAVGELLGASAAAVDAAAISVTTSIGSGLDEEHSAAQSAARTSHVTGGTSTVEEASVEITPLSVGAGGGGDDGRAALADSVLDGASDAAAAREASGKEEHLCPICMENDDDDEVKGKGCGLCSVCGLLFCGECSSSESKDMANCPGCRAPRFVSYGENAKQLKNLLATRAPGRHTRLAQYYLGFQYAEGDGVPRNYTKAIALYKLAIAQGEGHAMVNLGWLYFEGDGVKKDINEAVRLFKLGAKQGITQAWCNLAECYEYGNGVKKNVEEAVRLYRLAIDQEHKPALCSLANIFLDSEGVHQDYKEALRLYLCAAGQGCVHAMYGMGIVYNRALGVTQDYTLALMWYQRAANEGHPQAQCNLGIMHEHGQGVKQNYKTAFRLYTLSAAQGQPEARCSFFGRNSHSTMPLDPTPVRLNACDQWHSSRASTPLTCTSSHCKSRPNTEGTKLSGLSAQGWKRSKAKLQTSSAVVHASCSSRFLISTT
jgi:TPR repeat protein